MGDGEVCLILDVGSLIKKAKAEVLNFDAVWPDEVQPQRGKACQL